jgi:hypothetical protein
VSVSTADAPPLRHSDPVLARPLPGAIRDARADLKPIVADTGRIVSPSMRGQAEAP